MNFLKELICIHIYKGHQHSQGSVFSFGYNAISGTTEYLVICTRCNKTSLIDRMTLDKIIYHKNNGQS